MKLETIFLTILTSSWFVFLVYGEFDVVILHTNDVHARIDETNSRSGECSASDGQAGKCFGGVSRRKTVIDAVRSEYDNVLLLDAGDQFQGTIWFNYYKGREAYTFMNILNYDVMTLGNHEFDNGVEGLLPFLANVTFPVLVCNLNFTKEPRLVGLVEPYTLTEVAGLKVAIIGVLSQITTSIIEQRHAETLELFDEVESVRVTVDEIKQLTPPVNFVIVLSHSGFTVDVRIAQTVEGVDLVVGGHSNTFLYTGTPPSREEPVDTYPKVVTQDSGKQVPVVQAYAYGKYLGKLVLTFSDDKVLQGWSGNPVLLNSSYQQGNVLADALVRVNLRGPTETGWTKSAITLYNSGGIRASIEQGDVTLADVLGILPFSNEIVRMNITGSTLLKALENSVARYDKDGNDPPGGFLQVSGIRVVYNLDKAPRQRVAFVEALCIDCIVPRFAPVDLTSYYTITTNSFLASGGDGYSMLRDEHLDLEYLGYLASDQFEEFLAGQELVYGNLDGRIRFITNDTDITIPKNCQVENTITQTTSSPPESTSTCQPCDGGGTSSSSTLCPSLFGLIWSAMILFFQSAWRHETKVINFII